MKNSIQILLDSVDNKILARGSNYYSEGLVDEVLQISKERYIAEVFGSKGETYHIQIDMKDREEVLHCECSCPYELGEICKHIVAVLLSIQCEDYDVKQKTVLSSKGNDLTQVLKDTSKEELIHFVLQYAETDPRFQAEVLIAVGNPQADLELGAVKDKIKAAIKLGTNRGFIDYNGCDYICGELMQIIEIADKRISQEQYVLAFQIALQVLLTSVKMASTADSSSGYLTDVIHASLQTIDQACDNVAQSDSAKDRKVCYDRLIKEAKNKIFDGWGEWNYVLLRTSTYLVTSKNVQKLHDALDYLFDIYTRQEFGSYYITDDKLTRLAIMQKLEDKDTVGRFIQDNLKMDEFRKIAVRSAIDEGNYQSAEELCVERLNTKQFHNPYMKPADWWYFLYEIYQISHNFPKQVETAKAILIKGDMKYYQVLKELLISEGLWEQEYPKLLIDLKATLHTDSYMSVLEKEREWEQLVVEVRSYPYTVFIYGKQLAKYYANEIYEIYKSEIIKQAGEANSRPHYRRVCSSIKELHQAGGVATALNIIEEFLGKYKQRPAMQDELRNLIRKLEKVK